MGGTIAGISASLGNVFCWFPHCKLLGMSTVAENANVQNEMWANPTYWKHENIHLTFQTKETETIINLTWETQMGHEMIINLCTE